MRFLAGRGVGDDPVARRVIDGHHFLNHLVVAVESGFFVAPEWIHRCVDETLVAVSARSFRQIRSALEYLDEIGIGDE